MLVVEVSLVGREPDEAEQGLWAVGQGQEWKP